MKPRKENCPRCNSSLGYKYIQKHLSKCNGTGGCQWCGIILPRGTPSEIAVARGHPTWCEKNPSSFAHRSQLSKRALEQERLPISEETRNKMSESARKSDHRRLRKNPIFYKGVILDSTWELELAQRLDLLMEPWHRPSPLPWVDSNGKARHYFPDFYLPKRDLFLDPKNRYAFRVQEKKITALRKLYPNLIFLASLEEIREFNPDNQPLADLVSCAYTTS